MEKKHLALPQDLYLKPIKSFSQSVEKLASHKEHNSPLHYPLASRKIEIVISVCFFPAEQSLQERSCNVVGTTQSPHTLPFQVAPSGCLAS